MIPACILLKPKNSAKGVEGGQADVRLTKTSETLMRLHVLIGSILSKPTTQTLTGKVNFALKRFPRSSKII